MKAFSRTRYGGPEILELKELKKPSMKDDSLLVKVFANSVNPVDWHIIRGEPFMSRFAFGLFRPAAKIPGADFSGIVEETGNKVQGFKPGDHVFGAFKGAFAEYLCAPAGVCALMPPGTDFPEMACVPIAGVSAFQALIKDGQLREGESVLINGSSGGVGHFAVQIAKAYGAKVTGICSEKNIDFVKSLGADNVIAYDRENIHTHNGRYDLILDNAGTLHYDDFRRMGKKGIIVGFTSVGHLMSVMKGKAFGKFPLSVFVAKVNTRDLETLAALIRDKKISVHIERTFPSKEIPEAIRFIEAMRTRGKVAMVWE